MAEARSPKKALKTSLRDPTEAAAYLNAALKVGNLEVFLIAIQDVIEARLGGKGELANKMNLEAEHISLILSEKSNPELNGVEGLLDALGFTLVIQEKRDATLNARH